MYVYIRVVYIHHFTPIPSISPEMSITYFSLDVQIDSSSLIAHRRVHSGVKMAQISQ